MFILNLIAKISKNDTTTSSVAKTSFFNKEVPTKRVVIYLCFLLLIMFNGSSNAQTIEVDSSEKNLEQRVFEIAGQIRCPVCRSESVANSNATISIEMRSIIQEQLLEGKTEAEILTYFQASYGDWILLDPPKKGFLLIVWIAPLIAVVVALLIFLVLIRRWTKKANQTPIVLSDHELSQVRLALAQSAQRQNLQEDSVDNVRGDS